MAKKQTWITASSSNSVQLRAGDIYERPVFDVDALGDQTIVVADQPYLFVANDPDIAGNPEYVYQLDTSITAISLRIDYTFLSDFASSWAVNGEGGSGDLYIRRISLLDRFIMGDPLEGQTGGFLRLDHTLLSEGSEKWIVNTTQGGNGVLRVYNEIGDIVLGKTGSVSFFDLPANTIAQCTYLNTKLYVETDLRQTKVLTTADTSDLTQNIDYIFNISSNVSQSIANLNTSPQGRNFTVLNASTNGSTITLTAATGTKLNGVTDGSIIIMPNQKIEFVTDGTLGIYYNDIASFNTMGKTLLDHAKDVIFKTYGDTVSFEEKGKDLLKFGRNININGTTSTIWYTGKYQANEIYVADNVNSIDTISSQSVSDTEEVIIEGHTMSGNNRNFVVQTATLNGQNKVTLSIPLNRATLVSHNDQSSTNLNGEIYVYEDTAISLGKPVDETKIHITVAAGENESQKASTSISSVDYYAISSLNISYLEKSGSNTANFRLEKRKVGGVFKPITASISIKTGESREIPFKPYLIVEKNTDIRVTGTASANGQEVSAEINGFLGIVV